MIAGFLIIISIVIYILAPTTYSFEYCLLCHNVFILDLAYLLYKDLKNEKIGFNTLFSISFYFTNFVYPIFIYPVNPDFSLFQYRFDVNVVSKCTALALLAYSVYVGGYIYRLNKIPKYNLNRFPTIPIRIVKRLFNLLVIFIVLFIASGGIDYYEDRYERGDMSENLYAQYIYLFLSPLITLVVSSLLCFKTSSLKNIIALVLLAFTGVLLMSGTRTLPLTVLLMLLYVYSVKHKISNVSILIVLIVGIVLMSVIGEMRSGVNDLSQSLEGDQEVGLWAKFSDLIINNRNLYVFYDYVDSHSVTWGLSMVQGILSPIPFAQTLFMSITGLPYFLLGSPDFSTYLTLGGGKTFGLGTNLVGDVYLAFGIVGIFICFFILGNLIVYVRSKLRNGSVYDLIIYLVLLGDAVYLCRASYFNSFRAIVWSLLFAYILFNKYIKNEYITNHSRK